MGCRSRRTLYYNVMETIITKIHVYDNVFCLNRWIFHSVRERILVTINRVSLFNRGDSLF